MYNQRSFRGPFRGRSNGSKRPVNTMHESHYVKKAAEATAVEAFVPRFSFEQLSIFPRLKQNIRTAGYVNPTPIQDAALGHIFEGKNVIGIANTGTGKTAAFLVPLIEKVLKDRTQRALILVPTRELAAQIRDEFRKLAMGMPIAASLCIGGAHMRSQMYELRRNPQFVIGTPGRIKDFVNQSVLNLSTFNNVVLDEVDRMLDMGFIADIRYLLSKVPTKRQSLFFSATISPMIHTLIQSFVPSPLMVSVKKQDTTGNVEQNIIRVHNGAVKIDILEDLLRKQEVRKAIIFGRTKHGVEKLSRILDQRGFNVASIHGNKSQSQRTNAIRLFKDNRINILVATDVASRGIDIADITHVINYDQPATYDDYVHRIGRTGRADKKGIALTFVE